MPQVCTGCTHEKRAELDSAIVAGTEPSRTIAGRFGLSKTALQRHKAHVSEAIQSAAARQSEAVSDSLLGEARALYSELKKLRLELSTKGDVGLTLKAFDRATKLLELLGRFTGELQPGSVVNVNMPSPASAGAASQSFEHLDAATIADALRGELAPATLAQVARLLLEATSFDATGECLSQIDRPVRDIEFLDRETRIHMP